MDKHYYLIAQLPLLYFDKPAALDSRRFIEEAEKWLTLHELNRLKKVDAANTTIKKDDLPTLRAFKVYEESLRTELGNWRTAQKTHQDYKLSLFPLSVIKDGNPLQAEKNLLRLRWEFIEEMGKDHHFDTGFLVIYYLKLQLLERLATFNKERGLDKFKHYTEMEI